MRSYWLLTILAILGGPCFTAVGGLPQELDKAAAVHTQRPAASLALSRSDHDQDQTGWEQHPGADYYEPTEQEVYVCYGGF